MVIEDDRFNRLLYRDLLEGQGWSVAIAADGARGLAEARRETPDVILVDVQLPDMSGLDVIRTLKSESDLADVPTLVVSAHALEKHRKAAAAAGADAFVQKPFEFADLVSTIRIYLGEEAAS